jgi:hypothetical protein
VQGKDIHASLVDGNKVVDSRTGGVKADQTGSGPPLRPIEEARFVLTRRVSSNQRTCEATRNPLFWKSETYRYLQMKEIIRSSYE